MRKLLLTLSVLVFVLSLPVMITQARVDCVQRPTHPQCAAPTPTPLATATPAPTPTPTLAPPTPTEAPPAPTPSPTPTSPSLPNITLPARATFYYPWFPEAWNQQGMNPFTWYQPALGLYDTNSTAIIDQHVQWMDRANIDVAIASWWGQGHHTDVETAKILSLSTPAVKWAVYYELESADPTLAQVVADLNYILTRYGSDPDYARVNGRPVVFVYNSNDTTCAIADKWEQATAGLNIYVSLKVFSGYRTCANQPDTWHQYAPAVATDSQAGFSYAISPGFWKANEAAPRLARDSARFASNVASMNASTAPWKLVQTFNEWGEGSSIEPATAWGTTYLDTLAGDPAPSSSPAPAGSQRRS